MDHYLLAVKADLNCTIGNLYSLALDLRRGQPEPDYAQIKCDSPPCLRICYKIDFRSYDQALVHSNQIFNQFVKPLFIKHGFDSVSHELLQEDAFLTQEKEER